MKDNKGSKPTLSSLSLRLARAADEAGVARLIERLAEEGEGVAEGPAGEALAADRQLRRAFLVVATERRSREVVGFLRVSRGRLPRISHLGVAAAWQKRGLGIALIEVGLDLLARRGPFELAVGFEIDGPLRRVLDAWHCRRARFWFWLARGYGAEETPAGPDLADLPAVGLSLAGFLRAVELDPQEEIELDLWRARRRARHARRTTGAGTREARR